MIDLNRNAPNLVALAQQATELEDVAALTDRLSDRQPGEISLLLESLPPTARERVWSALPDDQRGEVLHGLHDSVRINILGTLSPNELITAARELDTANLTDVIDQLPDLAAADVLYSLDQQDRNRVEVALSYPENSAGRLLDPRVISVRPDINVDVVLRYLRRHTSLPPQTDALMVVDDTNSLVGSLLLTELLIAQPEQIVNEVMNTDPNWVTVDTTAHDVAMLFERHGLGSIAVVDVDQKLVGRITVDHAVNIIHEEADQALLSMAGLDATDELFAPILPSAARRAVWLGINLATAFLAAWVIGLFEATLQQVVALAVLMPIVASMGGIAGSQTLTLAIRGLALGQISGANSRWLAIKEISVGLINGLVWALVVAVVVFIWFGDWRIGAIIAVSLVVNMVFASVAGIAVPVLLDRLKLDPALSGSVILTTVTDVVGFFCFLGLGSIFLL